jgi:hypothetical protein
LADRDCSELFARNLTPLPKCKVGEPVQTSAVLAAVPRPPPGCCCQRTERKTLQQYPLCEIFLVAAVRWIGRANILPLRLHTQLCPYTHIHIHVSVCVFGKVIRLRGVTSQNMVAINTFLCPFCTSFSCYEPVFCVSPIFFRPPPRHRRYEIEQQTDPMSRTFPSALTQGRLLRGCLSST